MVSEVEIEILRFLYLYLSTDMQFHIASLIVVWAFLKSKKLGHLTNGLAVVLFTVMSFCLNYFNEYPPYSITTQPEVEYVDS